MEPAQAELIDSGELPARVYVFSKTGKVTIAPLNHIPHVNWPLAIALTVKHAQADRVVLASEAWWAEDDGSGVQPKDRENKEEIVMVTGRDRDGDTHTVMQYIDRDEQGKPVFKRPRLEMDRMEWSRLLDRAFLL